MLSASRAVITCRPSRPFLPISRTWGDLISSLDSGARPGLGAACMGGLAGGLLPSWLQGLPAGMEPDRPHQCKADHSVPDRACSRRVATSLRSGGVASAARRATASSSGSTSCAAPPSRRRATVRFSAFLAARSTTSEYRHVGFQAFVVAAPWRVDLLVGQVQFRRNPGAGQGGGDLAGVVVGVPDTIVATTTGTWRQPAGNDRHSARSRHAEESVRTVPRMARCNMTGTRREPSSATYSASSRCGIMKSTCSVPHLPVGGRSGVPAASNSSLGL